jgi:serine/threonine protein kinase/WD40 repeat protein
MASHFTLVLYAPDGSVQTWTQELGTITVGTDPQCEVVLAYEGVSARHTRLVLGAKTVTVEDLGSETGTQLDGEPITQPSEAGYPACIQIGEGVLAVDPVLTLEKPDQPHPSTDSKSGPNSWLPEVSGTFTLDRELGQGGMGRIYEGEDPQLKRRVAVKVSRQAHSARDARFFREAEVLAHLSHPNIVPVYSLGRDALGHPAYSMKLVKGRTLQSILNGLRGGDAELAHTFSRGQLLGVFLNVCHAMAFAHSKNFLHRDLKPENVMVGEFGEVLVMDWGLAALVEEAAVDSHPAPHPETFRGGHNLDTTLEGEVIGTPQYMSPEQAHGRRSALDQRSDIYSLGALLYSILTLHPPVEGKSLDQILRHVKDGQLIPFSRWESAPKRNQPKAPGTRLPAKPVPEALRAVTLKAMALAKEGRYQNVAEMETDITAYLQGFATGAENASFLRQALLLMRRHRAESALLGVLLLAVGGFTLKVAASEKAARASARVAQQQGQLARQNARIAEENASVARANEKIALEEKEEARRLAAKAQIALADSAARDLDGESMRRALEAVPEDLRDHSWKYLEGKLDTSHLSVLPKGKAAFAAIVAHPEKAGVFITAQEDGWLRTVNANTGKIEDLFKVDPAPGKEWILAVSSDGQTLGITLRTTTSTGFVCERPPQIYRLKDGAKLLEIPSQLAVHSMHFSPDGLSLLLKDTNSTLLQLWDTQTAKLRWAVPHAIPPITTGAFSEDSRRILVQAENTRLAEIDTTNGSLVRELTKSGIAHSYHRHPKVNRMFFSENGLLRGRDSLSGQLLFESRPAGAGLFGLGYITKGAQVVTATVRSDGCSILQLWAGQTGTLLQSVLCLGERRRMALHPMTGEAVILQSAALKIWRFQYSSHMREARVPGWGVSKKEATAFLGEPWRFLRSNASSSFADTRLEVLDLRDPKSEQNPTHLPAASPFRTVSTTPDGSRIAVGSEEASKSIDIIQRKQDTYSQIATWKVDKRVVQLRLSPDGTRVWTGPGLYEALTGRLLSSFERSDIRQAENGTSRWVDSKRIVEVAAFRERKHGATLDTLYPALFLWEADTGTRLTCVLSPFAISIAASPDGSLLAEGGSDRLIRIRNAQTLEVVSQFRAHDGAVTDLAWHPKLPLLVSLSDDLSVKIWNSSTQQLLEELRGFGAPPESVVISGEGSTLGVFFSREWKSRIWEPASFRTETK